MIISHSRKFIFIHIFKTAGTSVTESLHPFQRTAEKLTRNWFTRKIVTSINRIFRLSDNGNKWLLGVHKHAPATEVRNYLDLDRFDSYFKFAFVRNPFDWQVSLYHYIRQTKAHRDYVLVQELTFEEFVEREIARGAPTQSSFLCDGNDLIVDYVGKTETLDADMAQICGRLGIDVISIPRLNASRRCSDFSSYYTDRTRKLVADHFAEDFSRFGYDQEVARDVGPGRSAAMKAFIVSRQRRNP